jgi:hypothetical protein
LDEAELVVIEWRQIDEWLAVVASVPLDPPEHSAAESAGGKGLQS